MLPAPDGSGAIVAGLDLRTHEAFVEHSGGRETRIALTPNRPVAEVTREMLEAVGRLAGEVRINPTPQEVPWTVPLDEDTEHATYDADLVATYFTAAASQAALVLAEFRAPFRGRSTPVNAWWGTFDLAAHFFSGTSGRSALRRLHHRATAAMPSRSRSAGGPATRSTTGRRSSRSPTRRRMGFANADLSPDAARWDPELGEFVLDWDDIRDAPIPTASPWSSLARRSGTRARSADGIPSWRRAQRASRRRSADAGAYRAQLR